MNQNYLYLTLMGLPAFIMMMMFIISLAVVVLTESYELMECIAKALAVMFVVGGMYEIAIITYVALIKLIN